MGCQRRNTKGTMCGGPRRGQFKRGGGRLGGYEKGSKEGIAKGGLFWFAGTKEQFELGGDRQIWLKMITKDLRLNRFFGGEQEKV